MKRQLVFWTGIWVLSKHQCATEIEGLTQRLVQQQSLTPLPGSELLDERWLRFLTHGQLKKERLEEIWEHLERQDSDIELEIDIATSASSTASPGLTALDNIRTLGEVRLAPLIPAPVTEAPAKAGKQSQGVKFISH
jgi:hypothetical protein